MIIIDKKDRNPILAEYDNGNCHIKLYCDGTKIRDCGSPAMPEMPESIDLKITNYCDVGCPFCHEGSSTKGVAADYKKIQNILSQLRPGTEIAIGGGNPLSHPDIDCILYEAKDLGLISNLTVRLESLVKNKNAFSLSDYRRDNLLWGLGISGVEGIGIFEQIYGHLTDSNTTLHFIIGVDSPQEVIRAVSGYKVLILGFKEVGRGRDYYPIAKPKIDEWRYWSPTILSRTNSIVSFDNLAIEQLGLRNLISDNDWDTYYMGGEGEFTMYIDASADEYAISSAMDRWPIAGKSVKEMFEDVRTKSGYMCRLKKG